MKEKTGYIKITWSEKQAENRKSMKINIKERRE